MVLHHGNSNPKFSIKVESVASGWTLGSEFVLPPLNQSNQLKEKQDCTIMQMGNYKTASELYGIPQLKLTSESKILNLYLHLLHLMVLYKERKEGKEATWLKLILIFSDKP